MEIIWSPHALKKVSEIGDFIALDSIPRAVKFEDELLTSVWHLKEFPNAGGPVPEKEGLRQVIHHGYRIIYRIQQSSVEIITVISPGQNFNLDWQRFIESTLEKEWSSDDDDGL